MGIWQVRGFDQPKVFHYMVDYARKFQNSKLLAQVFVSLVGFPLETFSGCFCSAYREVYL